MGAGDAQACRHSTQPGAGCLGRGCWGDAAVNTAGSGGTSLAPDHGRAVGPMETPWQPPCTALPSSRLSPWAAGCQDQGQVACPTVPSSLLSPWVLPPAWGGISTSLTITVINEMCPRLSFRH